MHDNQGIHMIFEQIEEELFKIEGKLEEVSKELEALGHNLDALEGLFKPESPES